MKFTKSINGKQYISHNKHVLVIKSPENFKETDFTKQIGIRPLWFTIAQIVVAAIIVILGINFTSFILSDLSKKDDVMFISTAIIADIVLYRIVQSIRTILYTLHRKSSYQV